MDKGITYSAAERDATSTVAVERVVAGAGRREFDSNLFSHAL